MNDGSVDNWNSSYSVVWSISPSVGVWKTNLFGTLVVDHGRSEEELRGSSSNSHEGKDNLNK